MSVFKGLVTEFPGVIIDHFSVSNCKYGRAFFLSHCHKGALISNAAHLLKLLPVELDHMTGLSSEELIRTLRGR